MYVSEIAQQTLSTAGVELTKEQETDLLGLSGSESSETGGTAADRDVAEKLSTTTMVTTDLADREDCQSMSSAFGRFNTAGAMNEGKESLRTLLPGP